jgi:YebC/PmpR family DNA-binding regulatory protein
VIDAKRGKLFAKLIKNIEVAAKIGGADLAGNPTLFDAVQKAKKSSVPNDNINRAIKRGGGAEGGGVNYESVVYEGYASGGVAVLVECLTDNKNRAASDVRLAFGKNGGQLADPGSVSYLFSRKGVIIVPKQNLTEERILEATIEADVEDINDLGESFEIITAPSALVPTRELLQKANIDYDSADVVFYPASQVQLDSEKTAKVLNLIEALEDLDDVQEVYSNLDISDEVLDQLD